MAIESRDVEAVRVLDVTGDLTAAAGRALGDGVRRAVTDGARKLVLNLSGVTEVDAAGLGQIAEVRRVVSGARADVRLVVRDRLVREPLARTRLLDLFCVFARDTDAIASFRGDGRVQL